ncbi:MAG: FAD binding domain-containing protein [Acidocella sp.]|nr:FAD binding domain-containing protein [Acidocella sp.]
MDLHSIQHILVPTSRSDIPTYIEKDAYLAGGTWLFSEPQPQLTRLVDLTSLNWPALKITSASLQISATCKVAELAAFEPPPDWLAGPLILKCCRALMGSFKIWNVATIGGNLCLSLPAGPMTALASALNGVCVIWRADGTDYTIPAVEFVTGPQQNALRPGEILRRIDLPVDSLKRHFAFRQISLTHEGRSAALLIGTIDCQSCFTLTITAATCRPVQLTFPEWPDESMLARVLASKIPDHLYFDDIHGKPAWRKHMTGIFAQEISKELAIS